jgi:hypothetical protein
MTRLLVLLLASSVAIWVAIEFGYKAWQLFVAGQLLVALLSAAIAAFMVYLLQGYLRLAIGLSLRRRLQGDARNTSDPRSARQPVPPEDGGPGGKS